MALERGPPVHAGYAEPPARRERFGGLRRALVAAVAGALHAGGVAAQRELSGAAARRVRPALAGPLALAVPRVTFSARATDARGRPYLFSGSSISHLTPLL